MIRLCRTLPLTLMFGILLPTPGTAGTDDSGNPTILLPWTERKPYQFKQADGKLDGILYQLGETIFSTAGLPSQWQEIPANRIIDTLKNQPQQACLVGWFRSAEREQFSKFSLPIYRDKPQVALVRSNSSLRPGLTLKALAENPKIKVLMKQGYSYGEMLDQVFAQRDARTLERTTVNHARMLEMLRSGRADLLFLTQEELDFYRSQDRDFNHYFRAIHFSEIPQGNLRYVMCSQQVPDATMQRINLAIRSAVRFAAK